MEAKQRMEVGCMLAAGANVNCLVLFAKTDDFCILNQ